MIYQPVLVVIIICAFAGILINLKTLSAIRKTFPEFTTMVGLMFMDCVASVVASHVIFGASFLLLFDSNLDKLGCYVIFMSLYCALIYGCVATAVIAVLRFISVRRSFTNHELSEKTQVIISSWLTGCSMAYMVIFLAFELAKGNPLNLACILERGAEMESNQLLLIIPTVVVPSVAAFILDVLLYKMIKGRVSNSTAPGNQLQRAAKVPIQASILSAFSTALYLTIVTVVAMSKLTPNANILSNCATVLRVMLMPIRAPITYRLTFKTEKDGDNSGIQTSVVEEGTNFGKYGI